MATGKKRAKQSPPKPKPFYESLDEFRQQLKSEIDRLRDERDECDERVAELIDALEDLDYVAQQRR